MTVQVFYKNKINSKSSKVFALFTDENFKIQKKGVFFSKKEISFIKKITQNNKILKKKFLSFNLNEYTVNEISNDESLNENRSDSVITEYAGRQFFSDIIKYVHQSMFITLILI